MKHSIPRLTCAVKNRRELMPYRWPHQAATLWCLIISRTLKIESLWWSPNIKQNLIKSSIIKRKKIFFRKSQIKTPLMMSLKKISKPLNTTITKITRKMIQLSKTSNSQGKMRTNSLSQRMRCFVVALNHKEEPRLRLYPKLYPKKLSMKKNHNLISKKNKMERNLKRTWVQGKWSFSKWSAESYWVHQRSILKLEST